VTNRAFASVLAVLLTTGWAANHFAAVIPSLKESEGLSAALLDGVFGIYALGLLPGLFFGGTLSDRIGRAGVVIPGAVVATAGTVSLLLWHEPTGLLVGRLVVGIGAGLTIGAGTAWAADLKGSAGTVLAGVFLTAGFAFGPLVSGIVGQFSDRPITLPFIVSAVLSVAAIVSALLFARVDVTAGTPTAGAVDREYSATSALSWSLPMSFWVFASVTLAFVTLPSRMPADLEGPLLSGVAAGTALITGIAVQAAARRRQWGPRTGVVGSGLAAVGYLLVAVGGAQPPVWLFAVCCVVLGAAYGLCLRAGLLDLELFAPPRIRGSLTGVFYVGTYLGFGLPVLLVLIEPSVGIVAPMVVLAVLAAAASAARARRLAQSNSVFSPGLRNSSS
jgi:MFS family permease